MRTIILLIFCLAAATLNGCASRQSPGVEASSAPAEAAVRNDEQSLKKVSSGFHKLREGMTKDEVASIVGYPPTGGDAEVWSWRFLNTGMADEESYTIEFRDDRLASKRSAGIHYGSRQN